MMMTSRLLGKKTEGLVLELLAVFAPGLGLAYLGPSLGLKDIMATASVVCVASCETSSVTSAQTSEVAKGVQRVEAVFRVDQAIKGLTNSQKIRVELASVGGELSERIELPHLPDARWLLFLTRDPSVEGAFHLIDDPNAMISVGPRPSAQPRIGSARDCLEFEIANILKTDNEALVPRVLRLLRGWGDSGDEMQEAVRAATQSKKTEIKGGALALRISQGDIGVLPSVEGFRGAEGVENELRAAIASVTDYRAVPCLARIARISESAQIKGGAIHALRNMASPERQVTLGPIFTSALNANEREVQYDAIVGLGRIVGRIPSGDFKVSLPVGAKPLPAQVPSFDEFMRDPATHIATWQKISARWEDAVERR